MSTFAILVGLAVTSVAADPTEAPAQPQRGIDPGSLPSGTPPRLVRTEEAALKKVGATKEQLTKMAELQQETAKRFAAIRADYVRDNDTAKMFGRQLDVMKWSRQQTKQILGDEKYAAYQKHWDAVMKPALDNGKRNANARIPVLDQNGKPTGFQLRPLTSPGDKERFEKQLEEALKKRKAEKKSSSSLDTGT